MLKPETMLGQAQALVASGSAGLGRQWGSRQLQLLLLFLR
jgi:hypothetical protein